MQRNTEQGSTRRSADPQAMEKIIDAFIHKRLPQWLKDASAEDIGHLKTLMARHQATQDALSAATASALPVKMFATQAFAAGLASLLPVNVKLEDLDWRTKVRSIQGPRRRIWRTPIGWSLGCNA